MNKAYYSPMPSVLCKIFGVYKVASHNKETDKRLEENVVVMENIFYQVRLLYMHFAFICCFVHDYDVHIYFT